MTRQKFEDVTDDVREDVQQLARELWTVREQIKNRTEERDEATQVLKALKKRQEELVGKIAKCGQFAPATTKAA